MEDSKNDEEVKQLSTAVQSTVMYACDQCMRSIEGSNHIVQAHGLLFFYWTCVFIIGEGVMSNLNANVSQCFCHRYCDCTRWSSGVNICSTYTSINIVFLSGHLSYEILLQINGFTKISHQLNIKILPLKHHTMKSARLFF